jgi:hypothetical protein
MTSAELRRLARLGAEARLEALQREISAIYSTFPELGTGRSATNPFTESVRQAVQGAVTRRRRRLMSREARNRIAEAQRKRWAEWKAKQAKPSGTETASGAKASGRAGKKK